MTIAGIVQQAQRLLAEHAPPDPREHDQLLEQLRRTQDPQEASELYTRLINLPAPPAPPADPYAPGEFDAWCTTGQLPSSVAGLEMVVTIVELYRP